MYKPASYEQLKIYGEHLRSIRIKRGYTLAALAAMVSSNKQTLCNIEHCKYKSLNETLLSELAVSLDCTESYLRGETEDPKVQVIGGVEYIDPIEYNHIGVKVKSRIFKLCGKNIELLEKIATCLEKLPPKEKEIFNRVLDSFLSFTK